MDPTIGRFGRAVASKGGKLERVAATGGSRLATALEGRIVGGAARHAGNVLTRGSRILGSKAGMAAGFAVAGASDGIRGAIGLARAGGLDGNDTLKNHGISYWDIAGLTAKRFFGRGLLRGIDGALFGLTGLIPGYGGWVNSDDYVDIESGDDPYAGAATRDFSRRLAELEKDGSGATAKDYAQLADDRDKLEMANLAKGLTIDGTQLMTYTTDPATGEVSAKAMTVEEGARQAGVIAAARARSANERKSFLFDKSPKDVDKESVQHALAALDSDYRTRLDDIRKNYDDFATFAQRAFVSKRDRLNYIPDGATDSVTYTEQLENARNVWATSAMNKLNSDMKRRRAQIQSTAKYGEVIAANYNSALDTYMSTVGKTFESPEQAAAAFRVYWDNQDDSYRETTDGNTLMRQIVAEARESSQGQEG